MNHPLQILRPIKMLLLLQQKRIRNRQHTTRRLTMRAIRKRNTFIIREIKPTIGSFTRSLDAGQLRSCSGRSIVGSLEEGG